MGGNQKLRRIRWVKCANFLTFLSSVSKNLVPFIQPIKWLYSEQSPTSWLDTLKALGGLTKHFEELNVNESGTHGFNFPGNSHVLGNEGGQCLAKCALIYLTPKYIPPLSFSSPQNHSKLCLMSNYGCVLETLETWSGLSSWS